MLSLPHIVSFVSSPAAASFVALGERDRQDDDGRTTIGLSPADSHPTEPVVCDDGRTHAGTEREDDVGRTVVVFRVVHNWFPNHLDGMRTKGEPIYLSAKWKSNTQPKE